MKENKKSGVAGKSTQELSGDVQEGKQAQPTAFSLGVRATSDKRTCSGAAGIAAGPTGSREQREIRHRG